jgi:hypothetical protein
MQRPSLQRSNADVECPREAYRKFTLRAAEAHHTKPVETLVEGSKTKLEDLALLCANCHRMVHATRPWLTVNGLRHLLSKSNAVSANK